MSRMQLGKEGEIESLSIANPVLYSIVRVIPALAAIAFCLTD